MAAFWSVPVKCLAWWCISWPTRNIVGAMLELFPRLGHNTTPHWSIATNLTIPSASSPLTWFTTDIPTPLITQKLSHLSHKVQREVENINSNSLYDKYQSGFPLHNTETALVRVTSDLIMASDSGSTSLLILLNLSAPFNTVDHCTHLHTLQHYICFSNTSLKWFYFYRTEQTK